MRARQTLSKAFSRTFSSISLQKILQSVTMSQTTVLKVAMSCQGCAGAVRRVLEKLEGVETFDIDVGAKKVTVVGNVDRDVVFQTVSKSGKKTAYWEDEVPAAPAPEAVPAAPVSEAVSEEPMSEAVLASPASEAAPAAPAPASETGPAAPEPEAVPAAAPPAEAEAKPAETVAVA